MQSSPAPLPPPSPAATGAQSVVAETMQRVHEQLRRGSAPSFESLLAFGEPA